MNEAGLYIHIPFCRSKCPYCHFYSVVDTSEMDTYVAALEEEMTMYRHHFPSFATLYLGGGTPSLLTVGHIATLLNTAARVFTLSASLEITVEVNPADQDKLWLRELLRLGVSRIVLGVQSWDEGDIHFLGRRHTVLDAHRAVGMAREVGFPFLAFDLISGLPHQTLATWQRTLAQACALAPDHLSCYELTPEEHTPLYEEVQSGKIQLPGTEEQWLFFATTSSFLQERGFIHYEVSNYARSMDAFSRHNMNYWQRGDYLGLGPSAHSSLNWSRWWNVSSLSQYLSQISRHKLPIADHEDLSPLEVLREEIALGLRTIRGLPVTHIPATREQPALLERLVTEGYLSRKGERMIPTVKGMACADGLALLLAP